MHKLTWLLVALLGLEKLWALQRKELDSLTNLKLPLQPSLDLHQEKPWQEPTLRQTPNQLWLEALLQWREVWLELWTLAQVESKISLSKLLAPLGFRYRTRTSWRCLKVITRVELGHKRPNLKTLGELGWPAGVAPDLKAPGLKRTKSTLKKWRSRRSMLWLKS